MDMPCIPPHHAENVRKYIEANLGFCSGGGGVLDISLAGEVRCGPSYPDPV